MRRAVVLAGVLAAGIACSLPSTYVASRDAGAAPPDGAAPGDAAAGTDAAAPATDAAPTDAGIGALGAFGPPALLAGLSDPIATDDDPTLTADLLEIYFNSDRNGGPGNGDVWRSVRATPSDPWPPPELVTELNTADIETTPELSADGLTILFASSRPITLGGVDVWFSTRGSRALAWAPPTRIAELSSADPEGSTAIDASLLFLVMHSSRVGGAGGSDLYTSSRATTGTPWGPPLPIVELDTADSEANGFFSPMRLHLFFGSDRAGGAGGNDLWRASRLSTDVPFGTPVPIAELNTPAQDDDLWLSPDLRHAYFYSDRSGNAELYEALR